MSCCEATPESDLTRENSRQIVLKTSAIDASKLDKSMPVFCKLHNSEFKNYRSYQTHARKFHYNANVSIDLNELKTVETTKSVAKPVDATEAARLSVENARELVSQAVSVLINNTIPGVDNKRQDLGTEQFVDDLVQFIRFKATSHFMISLAEKQELGAICRIENDECLQKTYEDIENIRELIDSGDQVKNLTNIEDDQCKLQRIKDAAFESIGRWHEFQHRRSHNTTLDDEEPSPKKIKTK